MMPVTLPRADPTVTILRETAPIMFVVDDDVSVRESLEGLLQSAGWRSEALFSAEAFLDRSRVLVPSCLVLDVGLPNLKGDLSAISRAHRLTATGCGTRCRRRCTGQRHGDRTAPLSVDPPTGAIRGRQFEIEFLDPGVEVFAFTFG